jgi:hypothetical protein
MMHLIAQVTVITRDAKIGRPRVMIEATIDVTAREPVPRIRRANVVR